mmetsp:Transcript_2975/g.10735  ORF Transcript_2975/g.10735 Transcript_2975/m.10735 type:complete len:243 (-) Transcript_2975:100-828(-)
MSYGSGLLGQKLQAQRSLLLLRKISRFSVGLNLALILLLALLSSYGTLLRPRASETELQWDAERGTLMAELGNLTTTVRDKELQIENLQDNLNQLVVKLKKHEVSEQSLKSLSTISEKRAEEFENKLEKANEHQFECDLKYFTLQRSYDQQQTALNALKTELDSLENVKSCRDDFELAKSTLATETERVRILADEKKTLIQQLNELKRECIAKGLIDGEMAELKEEEEEKDEVKITRPKIWD